MKKLIVLLLVVVFTVTILCSCEKQPHRKLEFDDGTSYCFYGSCRVKEGYIAIGGETIFAKTDTEYFSTINREYTITECDCDNINN